MGTTSRTAPSPVGFTLLELVVVVAILAVLTTLAMVSLTGAEDQVRFDQSRGDLRAIEEGVLGATRDGPGATPGFIAGFVADVGRLPQAVGSDSRSQLQELWGNPRNLAAFGIYASPVDPEVLLESGWRGGYLRQGIGSSFLVDGW